MILAPVSSHPLPSFSLPLLTTSPWFLSTCETFRQGSQFHSTFQFPLWACTLYYHQRYCDDQHYIEKYKIINQILKTCWLPISHGFNDEGLIILNTEISGKLDSIVNCKQIIAVAPDRSHSVTWCSAGNSISSVLFMSGSRDCISIVATV
jgi:hypothetical protein